MGVMCVFSTDRTPGNAEANLAESSEFLSNADDKKTPHFTDFEGKTSFGMSVFNLGNAIMGSGILGLAYAMANTGIVLFIFPLFVFLFLFVLLFLFLALLLLFLTLLLLFLFLALLLLFLLHLLLFLFLVVYCICECVCMNLTAVLSLSPLIAMSSYLYIVKYEFPLVIQAFLKVDNPSGEWYLNGNYLVVIVSCSVILPLALMKQLGYLGYTSGFSLSCMVFFLIAVIYKKFQVKCPFGDFAHNRTVLGFNTSTAYAVPILAFAFVCHPEVLPIYTELRNPTKTKMQHVSNISIGVMYIMYLLAALFGYLTFIGEVEAELLHTYSRIDPYDTLILCVRVAVLTAVTLTVPIVLFPVRRAIQQLFFPNKTFWWPRHIAIAVTLLTLINLLVIFAPNILGIFGVIGATSAPCLIFIFPAVFYIRIVPKEEEPLRSAPKILVSTWTCCIRFLPIHPQWDLVSYLL
uniref:Sodium-coupled neutral amino acid transporter 3-like n=1 Tax=Sinocyclocheilus anshuiensis TaxID=1608454 RepID=A0A671RGA1_9TELE